MNNDIKDESGLQIIVINLFKKIYKSKFKISILFICSVLMLPNF